MGYLLLAVIKILDNIVLTAKSIATYKGQRLMSSVLVVISQLLFYLVINQVINDDTILAIVIVSVSSGIGNYIAFILNDKFKKDTKWTIVITSSDIEDTKGLCNHLATNGIKYIANDGYTRKGAKTIHVIAFSRTKNETRQIENYLKTAKSKYLMEII